MSKWINVLVISVSAVFVTATLVARAAGPATQPSGEHSKADKSDKHSSRWGYSPFNKLSGVTDEQRAKISEIHRKFLADRKTLEDKQETEVMALLTDDQKAELEKMKAEEKEKAAEHRKDKKDSSSTDDDKEKDKDK